MARGGACAMQQGCPMPVAMSALACAIAEHLTAEQTSELSAALVILSDCLAAIALCRQNEAGTQPRGGCTGDT